jgi:hypothetical protein
MICRRLGRSLARGRDCIVLVMAIGWVLQPVQVNGQTWGREFGTGVLNYQGELRAERFTTMGMRPAVAAGIQRWVEAKTAISARLTGGMLTGRDADNPYYLTRRRNLHFETQLFEFGLNGQRYLDIRSEDWFMPFVTVGLSVFRINPYTFDRSGEKVGIFDLSLEGQGLSPYPGVKLPRRLNLAIPVGAGINLRLTETLNLELEMMVRKTFTDQLDGVSGFFPSEQALRQERGSRAVDLSYRADELPGEDPSFPREGTMRGNPKTMDWYYGFVLRFVWNQLESYSTYPKRRKLFKPIGWPYRL